MVRDTAQSSSWYCAHISLAFVSRLALANEPVQIVPCAFEPMLEQFAAGHRDAQLVSGLLRSCRQLERRSGLSIAGQTSSQCIDIFSQGISMPTDRATDV